MDKAVVFAVDIWVVVGAAALPAAAVLAAAVNLDPEGCCGYSDGVYGFIRRRYNIHIHI